jgi:hypothetical protein
MQDLNSDDRLDIVVPTRDDGRVLWFQNNGDGSAFAARVAAQNLPGSVGVHSGDIDGDGRVDIVAASEDTNQIVWLRNNGAQPLLSSARSAVGPSRHWRDFAKAVFVADIDDDGDLDVVFARKQNKMAGLKTPARAVFYGACLPPTCCAKAYGAGHDWDGDLDIGLRPAGWLRCMKIAAARRLPCHPRDQRRRPGCTV